MFGQIKSFFKPKPKNTNVRILVIEDSEIDRKIACKAIELGGYTPLTAHDGQTGLSMAKELLPDLVILDCHLPDTRGHEVCKLLKEDAATRRIPVLFLTSEFSSNNIIDCYEQGGETYLVKPVQPKFLLKQINNVLEDTQKAQE